jgi:hypothetical protein
VPGGKNPCQRRALATQHNATRVKTTDSRQRTATAEAKNPEAALIQSVPVALSHLQREGTSSVAGVAGMTAGPGPEPSLREPIIGVVTTFLSLTHPTNRVGLNAALAGTTCDPA